MISGVRPSNGLHWRMDVGSGAETEGRGVGLKTLIQLFNQDKKECLQDNFKEVHCVSLVNKKNNIISAPF